MPENLVTPFAAVLLAGGRSTRMGRDKAGVPVGGMPLWQRQLATLRALGSEEIFISGRSDGPYAAAGVAILEDPQPDLGPLAGIAAGLARMTRQRLVVLAIDLPAMTAEFLHRLLRGGSGAVPRREGCFEPLAAVYPRAALPIAEQVLGEADRSMQRFVRRLIEAQLADAVPVTPAESALFQNVNTPGDLW